MVCANNHISVNTVTFFDSNAKTLTNHRKYNHRLLKVGDLVNNPPAQSDKDNVFDGWYKALHSTLNGDLFQAQ